MVEEFKLRRGRSPVYKIEPIEVETHIGRQHPWFVRGNPDRHYALCPFCENPIQLKALYNRTEKSPAAYGSHVGRPIEGFSFDESAQNACPYTARANPHGPGEKRPFDSLAKDLLKTAFEEFDRTVLILRDDLGFRFSDAFAIRMLESWLTSEGFRYSGAHLRNLPWMILYFGGSANLYRQPIEDKSEITSAVLNAVKSASLDDAGRLQSEGNFFRVELQALKHLTQIINEELEETVDVRIMDYTGSKSSSGAVEVYRLTVVFNPHRFEALIHTPAARAKRDHRLLQAVEALAVQHKINLSSTQADVRTND